jgi:hypothetical protein
MRGPGTKAIIKYGTQPNLSCIQGELELHPTLISAADMAEKTTDTTPIPGPQGLPLVGNALAIDLEFPLGTFRSFAEQYGKLVHKLMSHL